MMDESGAVERLTHLAAALVVGLIVGLERGWHERRTAEGGRIAGWRTFGLIGLIGGLWRVLAGADPLPMALVLVAIVGVLAAAHWREVTRNHDRGITTLMAAIATYAFGALAGGGYVVEAGAGAVVVAILLSVKSHLHGWLQRLSEQELRATLQFLLISLVILPLLPDRGYGPNGALNPSRIWTMVVVIAGLSFAGYAAIRIWGARAGLMLTALLGGIVASTALTLDFARRSATERFDQRLLAAGVLGASGVSFVRTAGLVGAFAPELLPTVAVPLGAVTLVAGAAAWFLWKGTATAPASEAVERRLGNPLELRTALQLGLILAVVLVLGEWVKSNVGVRGLSGLYAVTGMVEIDAATMSLCRMFREGLSAATATELLMLGLGANVVLKWAIVIAYGRSAFALRVVGMLTVVILAGGAAVTIAV